MNPIKHKIISAVFAIVYVVVVQWFAVPVPIFRFLVPAFLLYLIAITVYNWRYLLKQQVELNLWLLVRVPVFLLIWFGLLFVVPEGLIRAVYLISSLLLIFFFETLSGNKGQQLAWNLFLVSLVSLLLALYGFNFYFPLHGLVYLFLVFVGVLVLVRISVDSVPHENNIKWLAGLVLAMFAAQLFWALQFLPLHFSVLAILAFNLLYLLWAIYYHYLYQTLNLRQIQFNILLVAIFSLVILFSSPWTIQS